jgi:hypothetical protein
VCRGVQCRVGRGKIALSFGGKGSHCGSVYLAVAVLLGVNGTIFRVIMVQSGLETKVDL